jgi:hypothetical protein
LVTKEDGSKRSAQDSYNKKRGFIKINNNKKRFEIYNMHIK